MFKKLFYVKSFQKRKESERTYDLIIGKKEVKGVQAIYLHNCKECRCTSRCPYYFDQQENVSPNFHCLMYYNSIGNLITGYVGILASIAVWGITKNIIFAIPGLLLLIVALFFLKKAILLTSSIVDGISIFHEVKKSKKENAIITSNLLTSSPSSIYLKKAKNEVYSMNSFIKSHDFRSCNNLIQECLKVLQEIIKIVEDNNAYSRVSSLFEKILPEINNLIIQYSELAATDCIDSEAERTLSATLSKFLKYMEKVKKEAMLNSSEDIAKINFEASNDFICAWLDLK